MTQAAGDGHGLLAGAAHPLHGAQLGVAERVQLGRAHDGVVALAPAPRPALVPAVRLHARALAAAHLARVAAHVHGPLPHHIPARLVAPAALRAADDDVSRRHRLGLARRRWAACRCWAACRRWAAHQRRCHTVRACRRWATHRRRRRTVLTRPRHRERRLHLTPSHARLRLCAGKACRMCDASEGDEE